MPAAGCKQTTAALATSVPPGLADADLFSGPSRLGPYLAVMYQLDSAKNPLNSPFEL